MKHLSRTLVATAVLAATLKAPLFAQTVTPGQDLAQATLEELMQIRVTSAARKSQRVEDVPAAVYVITQSDIRRSGLTTLPELLRLVPGVQVAQVNANKWAVSIRGFNSLYSNKLLVLVDGRSVFSRTFRKSRTLTSMGSSRRDTSATASVMTLTMAACKRVASSWERERHIVLGWIPASNRTSSA